LNASDYLATPEHCQEGLVYSSSEGFYHCVRPLLPVRWEIVIPPSHRRADQKQKQQGQTYITGILIGRDKNSGDRLPAFLGADLKETKNETDK